MGVSMAPWRSICCPLLPPRPLPYLLGQQDLWAAGLGPLAAQGLVVPLPPVGSAFSPVLREWPPSACRCASSAGFTVCLRTREAEENANRKVILLCADFVIWCTWTVFPILGFPGLLCFYFASTFRASACKEFLA